MSQINSNIKDDFQVVLLLSCFVGHPVCDLLDLLVLILQKNVYPETFIIYLHIRSFKPFLFSRNYFYQRENYDWKPVRFKITYNLLELNVTPSPPFKYNTSSRDNYMVTHKNLQNLKYGNVKNQWKWWFTKKLQSSLKSPPLWVTCR